MKRDLATLEPLLPQVVASVVIAEAASFSGGELPDAPRLIEYLVNYAAEVTTANARFRRILKSTSGRDFLYAFMRHWLAAELRRRTPPHPAHPLSESFDAVCDGLGSSLGSVKAPGAC